MVYWGYGSVKAAVKLTKNQRLEVSWSVSEIEIIHLKIGHCFVVVML